MNPANPSKLFPLIVTDRLAEVRAHYVDVVGAANCFRAMDRDQTLAEQSWIGAPGMARLGISADTDEKELEALFEDVSEVRSVLQ